MKPALIAVVFAVSLSSPAWADPQAIRSGATLNAAQAGHAFRSACSGGQPIKLYERAETVVGPSFGWLPSDTNNEQMASWSSPDGHIVLVIKANALAGTCTLQIAREISGDGAELLEAVKAHLPRRAKDLAPIKIDGGLTWRWTRGTERAITFLETEGGHLIRYSLDN